MGCYDVVNVKCPKCGEKQGFHSKSGSCRLKIYELDNCPADIMMDINHHAPATCDRCGTRYYVKFDKRVTGNTISIVNVKVVAV